ncbi:hypothetical protein [Sulfuriferula sp.]|uniref:hypothetical protein n=1 Tax=Sulfuriferula sp. TaxID=2025307 RepID=UPI0027317C4E|nr:hypothetical protein [Sulfuriferula sp.]MDP2025101.1 hypothetical protein [Sulfuriferula sp.]
MIWLQFILCMALIGFAGTKLSRYGDIIADKTGMGGTWVGLVLMASVTSLPELITDISAVTVADAPNIAIGDVLGSCVFNLAFLVVVDFLYRGESVYTRASQGHILSAGFGVVLLVQPVAGRQSAGTRAVFTNHRARLGGYSKELAG